VTERLLKYRDVASTFQSRLHGVTPTQWDDPTPCEAWSVKELVAHVVNTHRRVYSMVDPSADVGDATGEDLNDAWRRAHGAIVQAVNDPAIAGKLVRGRSGERPFSDLVGGLLSIDTLCHTWDLARATAQDERLDPESVEVAHEWLIEFSDSFRVPGGFGPALEPAAGANAQTQFLNFAGRRP
jgi:uncharacterized protein (TIGR03086 family)